MNYDVTSPAARLAFRLLYDGDLNQFVIIGRGGYTVELPAELTADLAEMRRKTLATEQTFESLAKACDAVDSPAHG